MGFEYDCYGSPTRGRADSRRDRKIMRVSNQKSEFRNARDARRPQTRFSGHVFRESPDDYDAERPREWHEQPWWWYEDDEDW